MKLLFDQNLSPRLVKALADVFPGSTHVQEAGLGRATDAEVWRYAAEGGYAIVSKDSDFNELMLLHGRMTPVVWIRRGNCDTAGIERLLRSAQPAISRMGKDEFLLEIF